MFLMHVQEIELAENPYVATSTTAEGLALIFMMVAGALEGLGFRV